MVKEHVVVRNTAGIHVRPSGVIYTAIRGYEGRISVGRNDESVQLHSVMSIIALGLAYGDEIDIEVSGPGERDKLIEIAELFTREYDFPRRA